MSVSSLRWARTRAEAAATPQTMRYGTSAMEIDKGAGHGHEHGTREQGEEQVSPSRDVESVEDLDHEQQLGQRRLGVGERPSRLRRDGGDEPRQRGDGAQRRQTPCATTPHDRGSARSTSRQLATRRPPPDGNTGPPIPWLTTARAAVMTAISTLTRTQMSSSAGGRELACLIRSRSAHVAVTRSNGRQPGAAREGQRRSRPGRDGGRPGSGW